jgi:serine phosphatase RsbU (regulator of sigma subunit)/anti-sigma regulatory factor (Ser/Thr protein kinase)
MHAPSGTIEEALSIGAEACDFSRASAWLETVCDAHHVPVDERYKLDLCLNEALANVLAHGGSAAIAKPIALALTLGGDSTSGTACLTLTAAGVAFDPGSHQTRPAPMTLEEAEPGGLGILLMRANADCITYERRGDANCTSFLVHWGSGEMEPTDPSRPPLPAADAITAPASSTRQELGQFLRRRDRRNQGTAISPAQGERRQGERRQLGLSRIVRLFQDVPEHVLIEALDRCEVVDYSQATVLLERGAVNRHVYILLSGQMTLDLGTEDSPHPITLTRGQSVGEMSIADGSSVSARVTAEIGSRILVIDEDAVWARLMVLPGVARNLLAIQAERIRRSNDLFIEKLRGEMAFAQLKRDLAMAAEIQINMLPRSFPLYPDRHEFDLYATMLPAREVGGDFYDAFMVDRDHLFFIVGDVSGKGVAAALFMARAMTLFRVEAAQSRAPHRILRRVNDKLAENNDRCMFVTVNCGVLDARTGGITYSNAGHGAPLLGNAAGFRFADVPPGMAIGLMPESVFTSMECRLAPGETFLLYTDGVTEAADTMDREYSEPRLVEELCRIGAGDPRQTVTQLCESVASFSGSAPQSDDITVLAVRYLSPGAQTASA